ncbi:MAG: hypothetical protein KJN79_08315, partial [Gammaproteobacteria bacterium]|nr:hypothetical protein [Gammaproteobacteria bacterium]
MLNNASNPRPSPFLFAAICVQPLSETANSTSVGTKSLNEISVGSAPKPGLMKISCGNDQADARVGGWLRRLNS